LHHGAEIANWPGKEVTAACCVNDEIVCAALDGRFYVIRNGDVETLKHKESGVWWSASAALDSGQCLFGGDLGRLMIIDLKKREFHFDALREHGIDKPGRDVLHIHKHGDALFLLGTKELLVRYRAGKFTQCLESPRSETFFESAACLSGSLWICAKIEGRNMLAEYTMSSGKLVCHSLEIVPPLVTPAIMASENHLYLGRNEIYRGLPGNWQKVGEFNEERVVRLLPLANQPDSILVIGCRGKAETIRFPMR
jgi:hypothetical protein